MNPRDRRLRLSRTTVRDLMPTAARQARGGTMHLDTKNTQGHCNTGYSNSPEYCHNTIGVDTCDATYCLNDCEDTAYFSCIETCFCTEETCVC